MSEHDAAKRDGAPIWYELITPDPDAAESFYRAVLGWSVGRQPGPVDYRVMSAPDGGGVGGLMARSHPDMPAAWLGYYAMADVDAGAERVRDLGGAVHVPPTDIPGVGRFALCADPQGIPFYLMRGDSDGVSAAFAPDGPGHGAWAELRTSDQAGATSFFRDLLGWTVGGSMPMGAMGSYDFLHQGDRVIGAVMTNPPGDQRPGWVHYFVVESAAAAAGRIEAAGGRVAHGPHEVPGGSHVVIALDPQGIEFGVVAPEA